MTSWWRIPWTDSLALFSMELNPCFCYNSSKKGPRYFKFHTNVLAMLHLLPFVWRNVCLTEKFPKFPPKNTLQPAGSTALLLWTRLSRSWDTETCYISIATQSMQSAFQQAQDCLYLTSKTRDFIQNNPPHPSYFARSRGTPPPN